MCARYGARLYPKVGLKDVFPIEDSGLSSALYGLGKSYRAQGRNKEARDAYRVYLLRFPNGRDASAARRQIDELAN